jgi:hypothetical protein
MFTDVALTMYNKLAHGAKSSHPIFGSQKCGCVTQYVDDKAEMINSNGINNSAGDVKSQASNSKPLFQAATENTRIWTSLLWLSGGNLNSSKCFYYYIHPKYNFKQLTIAYLTEKNIPGNIFITNPATNLTTTLTRIAPTETHRTFGVFMTRKGMARNR